MMIIDVVYVLYSRHTCADMIGMINDAFRDDSMNRSEGVNDIIEYIDVCGDDDR